MATPTELARIAALANALRPEWPIRSVLTYLEQNHAARAYRDLAVAMAHVACDPETKTPRRLSESGPWWRATCEPTMTAIPAATDARCTVYGHEHYRLPCRGCRAEALAANPTELTPAVPAVTPRDATHAAHIRTLTREPDRTPDARERAAGLDREKDTDV